MAKARVCERSAFSAPDADWAEAVRREAAIRPLADLPRLGRHRVEAASRTLGISVPRVYALLRSFRDRPVTASLLPRRPGPPKGARLLAAPLETQIEAAIEAVYLRPERPTVKRVWGEVRRTCHAAGMQPPSLKALRARVSARSLRDRVRAREGAAAASDRFRQVRVGLRTERPLQVVQIDHTKVDIMLVDDVTRACIGRPWLTLVLDVHTRMVLGLYLSLDAPSATSAALAVAQAVLPKTEWLADRGIELAWAAHGLPAIIHVDNGREFHSRAFERGCQQHGIRIEYRPPATPRFGGHIERLMGTLMGRVHALPGSTSSNVGARGAYDSEARAVLSFWEFERILALEVLGAYHNEIHSALGRTPASAWVEGASGATPRVPADAAALLHDFLPFEERIVRRDGVRLFGVIYQDGALAHLVDHGPGKMRVKYDPRDLSAVFVELPAGDHVRVPYADLGRPPITLWEHREATRMIRAEGRRTVDEHAIFAAVAEQRRVLLEAQSRSKAARRAVARLDLADRTPPPKRDGPGTQTQDTEAKVPMPREGETSGVEFW
ncbi:Mu transposase C-terminal domain-containing protein [Lichenicoccus sp.]|uniref:Mu transposase C-terminal domain-containing protein n=1 Tax=Lichenicoccus sp. TaxID=2781899 RepID=UPI003D0C3617